MYDRVNGCVLRKGRVKRRTAPAVCRTDIGAGIARDAGDIERRRRVRYLSRVRCIGDAERARSRVLRGRPRVSAVAAAVDCAGFMTVDPLVFLGAAMRRTGVFVSTTSGSGSGACMPICVWLLRYGREIGRVEEKSCASLTEWRYSTHPLHTFIVHYNLYFWPRETSYHRRTRPLHRSIANAPSAPTSAPPVPVKLIVLRPVRIILRHSKVKRDSQHSCCLLRLQPVDIYTVSKILLNSSEASEYARNTA